MLLLVFAGAFGFLISMWLAWSLGALSAVAIATVVGALAIAAAALALAARRSGCKTDGSTLTGGHAERSDRRPNWP